MTSNISIDTQYKPPPKNRWEKKYYNRHRKEEEENIQKIDADDLLLRFPPSLYNKHNRLTPPPAHANHAGLSLDIIL